MNKINKKYFWSFLFALFMIGVTFYIIFKNHEIEQIIPTIQQASLVYVILALLLMLLFNICEASAIRILMRSFSYAPTFGMCLKYAFVGFYFSAITPSASGGQPMQIYYMKKDGIEIGTASLGILIITVSYQIGMLLLGLIMFLSRPFLISDNIGFSVYFLAFGVTANLVMIVTFLSIAFHSSFLRNIILGGIRLLKKMKLIRNADSAERRVDIHLEEYRTCAVHIQKNIRILFYVLAITITRILSRLSVAYAVYRAFGLYGYNYIDIIALQTMLALAVESLPLPGAIGASETGFLNINTKIFGADKLVPAMLLTRGISFYFFLFVSGVISLSAQISGRAVLARKKDEQA